MELFHVIDDAQAIVRFPRGIIKQTKLYRRGRAIYIPQSGGYMKIRAKFGDEWTTGDPNIKVLEFDCSWDKAADGSPQVKL